MKNSLIIGFILCALFSLGQNKIDAQGKKQGPWSKAYPNSRYLQYKGQFIDDIPTGIFYYYYPDGRKKAVIDHGTKAERSVATYYSEEGKKMSYGIFRNQKKDSIWVYYTKMGGVSYTESYKNGLLDGPTIVYYFPDKPGSKVQPVSSVTNYSKGKLNGEYLEYFDSGELEIKGKYLNGEKEGVWEQYHTNGKVMSQSRYKKGVRHGYQYAFDQSGKKISEQYFYQGKKLTGKALTVKLAELKKKGIDPNQ
jgi:antitoxin component YwqK of YwqJK toxin-antitoxin module